MGGRLERLAKSRILTVTDGAPANGADASAHGFSSLETYRDARRRELEAALAQAGLSSEVLMPFDGMKPVADQTAALHLAQISEGIARAIYTFAPTAVLTHPYEGGHPDHDACAFAVHAALRMLQSFKVSPTPLPVLLEAPFYHAGPHGTMRTGDFLPISDAPAAIVCDLSATEQAKKRERLACFATQAETLSQFGTTQERFRVAPHYDFGAPPHPGQLFYEYFPWGMTGERFQRLTSQTWEHLLASSKPVGPGAVGGAEVILSSIEAALPTLGFRSVVVAHAESQPQGRLYATPVPAGTITDIVRAEVEHAQQCSIDHALAAHPVALVHMHGLDFYRYRIPAHIPVLVTLHLPLAWYPEAIWQLPAQYHLVCVSDSQRQACPEPARARLTVVANGVPLPDVSTLSTEGRYALMMARICREKNVHTGLEAARLAGMPVLLAGAVFPYETHQHYFAEEIEPRLACSDNPAGDVTASPQAKGAVQEARFLGPVTGAAKAQLLAHATCLLLPSLAPETSSLVAMEALAAGVPVIAIASGAVPEIVEEGRTGLLFRSPDELQAILLRLLADPAEGRAIADAARAYVVRHRMLAYQMPRRVAWYRALWERRESLRAALLQRVPALAGPALAPAG